MKGGREGGRESPAISYESDFLPSVKNSRCGIVTHAADMGRRGGRGIFTRNICQQPFPTLRMGTAKAK